MALASRARSGCLVREGKASYSERPIRSSSGSKSGTSRARSPTGETLLPGEYAALVPSLVLGPLLRYVGETDAVFWVETDAPCQVEVLDSGVRTFHVEGHHYGLVRATGLERGAWHEYEVSLDGAKVWP